MHTQAHLEHGRDGCSAHCMIGVPVYACTAANLWQQQRNAVDAQGSILEAVHEH